jgi:predicted PurR-regulated permease PerM
MTKHHSPYTFDRVTRIVITLISIIGAVLLLHYLRNILIPFALAVLLAYISNPLVTFIQKKAGVKNRVLSVFISLILIIAVITGVFWLVVPTIINEISHMGELIRNLAVKITATQEGTSFLPKSIENFIRDFVNSKEVQDFFDAEKFQELTLTGLKKILPGLMNIFTGTVNIVFGIVIFAIVLLYLVFILIDYERLMQGLEELIPEHMKEKIWSFIGDFRQGMRNYFRAQALIATIVGILFAIGFSIINLPLGIAFGIFVGILNLVPYLQTIALIPATILALMYSLETGNSFLNMMFWVLVVFAAVQTIQETLLTPKIMGKAMKMNPAIIILSLSVWAKILGFLGLIIALPTSFLLYSYYKIFLKKINTRHESADTDPGTI